MRAEVVITGDRVRCTASSAIAEAETADSPDSLWRSVLSTTDQVLLGLAAESGGELTGVRITNPEPFLLIWDAETLSAPRPRLPGPSDAAAIHRLPEDEPHLWAWIRSGRCVLGSAQSYAIARATRGVWHVTSPEQAELSDLFDPVRGDWRTDLDVPPASLPEIRAGSVSTDPASFLGRRLAIELS